MIVSIEAGGLSVLKIIFKSSPKNFSHQNQRSFTENKSKSYLISGNMELEIMMDIWLNKMQLYMFPPPKKNKVVKQKRKSWLNPILVTTKLRIIYLLTCVFLSTQYLQMSSINVYDIFWKWHWQRNNWLNFGVNSRIPRLRDISHIKTIFWNIWKNSELTHLLPFISYLFMKSFLISSQ